MPKGIYKHQSLKEETRKKISDSHKGYKFTNISKKKMSEAAKGRKHSQKTIVKMRKLRTLEHRNNISKGRKGIIFTEEHRKHLRKSAFEYVQRIRNILFPCIGHNEKKYLDYLEQSCGYKILRQYKIEGYFVDGYIPELNVVIEVDERPKIQEKDIERENIIKNKLNCKFIRINDYD